MAEYSLALDGKEWRDNEKLVDWRCSRCKALMSTKNEAVTHIRIEHDIGSASPKINAIGFQMIYKVLQFRGLGEKKIAKIIQNEPELLSIMGFRTEVVSPENAVGVASLETDTFCHIKESKQSNSKVENGEAKEKSLTESPNETFENRALRLGVYKHRMERLIKLEEYAALGLTQEQMAERTNKSVSTIKGDIKLIKENGTDEFPEILMRWPPKPVPKSVP